MSFNRKFEPVLSGQVIKFFEGIDRNKSLCEDTPAKVIKIAKEEIQ